MPTTISEKKIQEIIDEIQRRTSVVLMRNAEQMAKLSAQETVALLKKMGYKLDADKQQKLIDRVVEARMATYATQLKKGGSECVERVLTMQKDGTVKATTQVKFIPWLRDRSAKEAEAIQQLIRDGTASGRHPDKIAKDLKQYLDGTKHNAVTVARTESAKIKSDLRWDTMMGGGVKHFMYLTAGDNRVRPEHALRDHKIYRAEDCVYLGEPNCRCVYVPADYEVEFEGATVEKSGAITLSREQAGL